MLLTNTTSELTTSEPTLVSDGLSIDFSNDGYDASDLILDMPAGEMSRPAFCPGLMTIP